MNLRSPHTNLLWHSAWGTEKAYLVVEWLQVHGLLWTCSRAWSLPALWTSKVWMLPVMNLDAVSLHTYQLVKPSAPARSEPIPLFGESPVTPYLSFSFAIAIAVTCLMCCLPCIHARLRWYHRNNPVRLARIESAVVRILDPLLVPLGLVFLRGFACVTSSASGKYVLDVDRTCLCWTTSHMYIGTLSGILCTLLFVAYPVWTYCAVRRCLVHDCSQMHEKYLLRKEVESLLRLDGDEWIVGHFDLISSFRRDHAYFRVWSLVLRIVILLLCTFGPVFSLTVDAVALKDIIAQQKRQYFYHCFIVLLVLVIRSVSITWRVPYRCASSNFLALVLNWATVLQVALAWVRVDGWKSVITLDSSFAQANLFIFYGAICICFVTLCYFTLAAGEEWPLQYICNVGLRGHWKKKYLRRYQSRFICPVGPCGTGIAARREEIMHLKHLSDSFRGICVVVPTLDDIRSPLSLRGFSRTIWSFFEYMRVKVQGREALPLVVVQGFGREQVVESKRASETMINTSLDGRTGLMRDADPSVGQWIMHIKAANELRDECLTSLRYFVPTYKLAALMEKLHQCCLEADSFKDSRHEMTPHILAPTLKFAYLDLLSTFRKYQHVTFLPLPNPHLEGKNMAHFAARLRRRKIDRLSMDPRKKRILNKLFIIKTWMGDRRFKYIGSTNTVDKM